MSKTTRVTCPHCGGEHEVNPAQLLAQRPRTMTPAKAAALARATEGRKAAAKRRREDDEEI